VGVRDVAFRERFTFGSSSCEDVVNATVAKTELESLIFTSDHGVLTNQKWSWTDDGTPYGEPEWEDGRSPLSYPISHTKNDSISVTALVSVLPPGTPPATYQISATGPPGFTFSGSQSLAGGESRFPVTSTDTLQDKVYTFTPPVQWTVTHDGCTCVQEQAGPERTYVTYGTPVATSTPTEKRVSNVCQWADGESTIDGIALRIWQYLTNHEPPIFDLQQGSCPAPCPWSLMREEPPTPGQCIDLAVLMQHACGVIGVPGSIGYVYATTDMDNFSASGDAEQHREYEYAPGQKRDEYLRYFASGGFNNWEAVCVVNGHYYAVKETHNSETVTLIKDIICPNELSGNYQCWRYRVYVPPPGQSYWTCNTEDQYPAPLPGGCPQWSRGLHQ
jgi:hypothetical protein